MNDRTTAGKQGEGVAALLEGAAPGDLGRLRRRLGDEVIRQVLETRNPSRAVQRLAAAEPDPWIRRLIAETGDPDTEILGILLERPDPGIDRLVHHHPAATPAMRRTILDAGRYPAPPEGAPHPLEPLWRDILGMTEEPADRPHLLAAGVVAPCPAVVRHVLRVCAAALCPAEQVRAALSLAESDPDGPLAVVSAEAEEIVRPLAGGVAGLRAAVAVLEGPEGLLAELRVGRGESLAWRPEPDWDALLAEHRRLPWPARSAAALAADARCPLPLLVALYTAHPAAVGAVARAEPALLRAAVDTPRHPGLVRFAAALAAGKGDGTPGAAGPRDQDDAERLIRRVAPARTAVAVLAELYPHDTSGGSGGVPAADPPTATDAARGGVPGAVPSGPAGPPGGTGTFGCTDSAPGGADPVDATELAGPSDVRGPAVSLGLPGATGAARSTRAAGVGGPSGSPGPAAVTGSVGSRRPVGSTGAAESTGAAGSMGAVELAGAAGPAGTAGFAGPSGFPASAGSAGAVEDARAAGFAGPSGAAASGGPAATAMLRSLLHGHLGADPGRWAVLRAALPRHRGTLPELLAGIAEGRITEAASPGGLARNHRHLLFAADPADLRALLPELPATLVDDLLRSGRLPSAVIETVLASVSPRAWAALGRNNRVDVRVLKRLVAKGDSATDASVYRNQRATPSLRRVIAARAALDPELRVELLTSRDRRLLMPLLVSGDVELTAHALTVECRKTAQHHACVRVWERGGPDAVRTLLTSPGPGWLARQVRARVEAALEAPDGLDRLRAADEPYGDPATLARLLQTRTSRTTVRALLEEPYAHDFRMLMDAHAKSPFATEAVDDLLRHEDATDEDRVRLRLALLNTGRTAARTIEDQEPAAWLAGHELPSRAGGWLVDCVREGFLDSSHLTGTARPAHRVTELPEGATEVIAGMRRDLAPLVREHLAGHPEAWAVATAMFPTFTGTLRELVVLAAQAAGPRPDPERLARIDAAETSGTYPPETPAGTSEPAGAAAASTAGPAPASAERPPLVGRVDALAAADLLRTLAPEMCGGPAPLPTDSEALTVLADVWILHAPGFEFPHWLLEACFASPSEEPRAALAGRIDSDLIAHQLLDLGETTVAEVLVGNHVLSGSVRDRAKAVAGGPPVPRAPVAPPPTAESWPCPPQADAVLRWVEESFSKDGRSGQNLAQGGYRYGIVSAGELLGVLPTRVLGPLPAQWLERFVAVPMLDAARAMIAGALGTDAALWLRALTAMGTPWADEPLARFLELVTGPAEHPTGGEWKDLLPPDAPVADPRDGSVREPRSGWRFPPGDLLSHAGADVLGVVLPLLGPGACATLMLHLLRAGVLPEACANAAVATGDRTALLVPARQARSGRAADLAGFLLALDDPEVNAVLYGDPDEHGDARLRRAVLSRRPHGRPARGPGDLLPLAPALRDRLLAGTPVRPAGVRYRRLALEAADPDVIDHTLRLLRPRLKTADQLIAAGALVRHGGPERLRAAVGADLFGATATAAATKALASPDPLTVLDARIAREFTTDRLLGRLRRCTYRHDAEAILEAPYTPDWDRVCAEDRREPFTSGVRAALSACPGAPADFRASAALRRQSTSAVAVATLRGPGDARAAVAVNRRDRDEDHHVLWIDALLDAGLLSGEDLVHEAAGADRMLRYIAELPNRSGAPESVRAAGIAARTRLGALLAERIGTDAAAWQRLFVALTGRDPHWRPDDDGATIAALLAFAAAGDTPDTAHAGTPT